MPGAANRIGGLERWIAWVRLGAVPFAIFQVSVSGYPVPGFRPWAIGTTVVFVVGALVLFRLAHLDLSPRAAATLSLGALCFDALVLGAYVLSFAYEAGTPTRQVLFLVVVEAAVRYGTIGAVATVVASAPVLAAFEELRRRYSAPRHYRWDYVTFQLGVELFVGLILGWLVRRLGEETERSLARANEAETLRDELGRRADQIDAANRCARALSSSLVLDEAFAAFVRELSGLLPFDRVAITLAEDAEAHTLVSAGRGEDIVFPRGARTPVAGTLLAAVLAAGQTVERQEMDPPAHPEERAFLQLGLHARVAAPVFAGPRPIGMLALSRVEANSFSRVEVELVTLLGRLVGAAVQNIRAYEAERATVEELRDLSALRADFVSLVSHELRSPMAAVIGSARTLQQRWRTLTPEQRDAFLALIGDETNRLAMLVADVLDTSRIESGTFSYSFGDVDLARLLRDAAAAAELGHGGVPVRVDLAGPLPSLRGDRERLRQVVANLLDNAIKYSPHGEAVELRAWAEDGRVNVVVQDRGPGVAPEHRRLIFEKFGRAGGGSKPGSGLGLFIARSIAEAHGGSVAVESADGGGARFLLTLPAG
jgi:signal transduction histidine kinase